MVKKNNRCLKKKNLKVAPEECSPEQIKECHGNEKDHPCVKKENTASEYEKEK